MQEDVTFISDGLTLSGRITLPADYKAGERRPAVIVLHGFGSTKNSGNVTIPCEMLSKRGYVTLGFDMRGCGVSEGEKGRVICLEQVADTQSAISFLQTRPEVDPNRIALLGSSFGAAVAVYTGSVDERVAAAVAGADGLLSGRGRVLLRASGTEPLIRVMVEGEDGVLVERLAGELADVVRAELA